VNQPAIGEALAGRDSVSLLPQPDGVLQVVTVPVALERPQPEVLGTMSAGFLLDDQLAAQLKRLTGSDIAFGMDGQILAATLPRDAYAELADRLRSSGISRVQIGDVEYEALPRPLAIAGGRPLSGAGPVALILRSRTEQLQSLQTIHRVLGITGVVAVLLATLLSFAVARTITRPLAAITDVMRDVAATGDLTQKIALRHGNRWDDEDARLLASTFNTLTDSIARFQREISQKERLSSLGRMSTVIAHEIRNPLMIIKASLHGLRRGDAGAAAMREAVNDIDEEVARLNRIVNEVLDFARPIRFELAPVNLNALCRESAAAAQASAPGPAVALDLDPAVPTLTTDAERLRIALVNMLVNARHAVNGNSAPGGDALVTLHTRATGDRVRIIVADRGVGIEPAALAHVFDPYFTTKRGGTGLGLPITKNIVEGLGGTIGVSSVPGRGTEIRIELPVDSRAEIRPVA
jgi:signal transduction histidine kinase